MFIHNDELTCGGETTENYQWKKEVADSTIGQNDTVTAVKVKRLVGAPSFHGKRKRGAQIKTKKPGPKKAKGANR
ncbi:hypothetical protein DSCO28_63210 [Desulfosarcina ovata subsp. sediminis]|uniref:Uncharacterized protein n=1 Tax=Desulfosarcina ovata subsp. sediminis TaxID=885957 RepID=A0A5K7ZZN9_9BACT|nr:hypothetical protein [Desulfosarcina ovata]BBO85755.1 hypothetical protein DSCO28_63210 [Desulfosarcina ovata subsp. sediminis]